MPFKNYNTIPFHKKSEKPRQEGDNDTCWKTQTHKLWHVYSKHWRRSATSQQKDLFHRLLEDFHPETSEPQKWP